MVVSIVENWDTMPESAQIVTFRLPGKTMVKGSDNQQIHHGSANSQINKGQRNYVRGKVNHVTAE
jgi:hypothetical protein